MKRVELELRRGELVRVARHGDDFTITAYSGLVLRRGRRGDELDNSAVHLLPRTARLHLHVA